MRLVQANALDLDQFQFDFDLTFAVFFMNADGSIYGRYGSRSSQQDAEADISLTGLRKAMEGALELHRLYPINKKSLAGKKRNLMAVRRPEELPSLARYKPKLDYEGAVTQSCMHCHQIRDAERRQVRESGQPLPDVLLYPYPMPSVLGLKLDVQERATVERVAKGTSAAADGFRPGDQIVSLAGQPILSIADVQWVLHTAAEPTAGNPTKIPAEVRRGEEQVQLELTLPSGWRKASDISWRTTSWDLRRMAGGMKSDDLTDAERTQRGLDQNQMALLVKHVGQYGEHQNAKRAGIQKDDLIVGFDSLTERLSESQMLVHVVQKCRPGQKVPVKVRRGEKVIETTLTLQ